MQTTAAERLRAELRTAVADARAAGLGWAEIGEVLGIPAETARVRFDPEAGATGATPGAVAPPATAATAGTEGPEPARRLGPVTIFNEMDRLAHAGRHGWRVVGAGTAIYLVNHTDQQWEFRRALLGRGAPELRAAGWQQIGTGRFPWAYFQRPTGVPAEPEDVVGGFVVAP